jgi:hypothetical protein
MCCLAADQVMTKNLDDETELKTAGSVLLPVTALKSTEAFV